MLKWPTWRLLTTIYKKKPDHSHCLKATWAQQTASTEEVNRIVRDNELESTASFIPAALTSVEVPFAPDQKGNIWMNASLEDFDGVTSLVLFNERYSAVTLTEVYGKDVYGVNTIKFSMEVIIPDDKDLEEAFKNQKVVLTFRAHDGFFAHGLKGAPAMHASWAYRQHASNGMAVNKDTNPHFPSHLWSFILLLCQLYSYMQCNVLTAIDRVTNATLLKDGRYGTEDAALGDEFEVKVTHKKWLIKEEGAEVK